MKLNRNITTIILLSFFITALVLPAKVFSQNLLVSKSYPTDFRPPLDLNPSLAGSFGEIRPNHFHSGIDYRTNQREGYPVYAVADGYISRLRVQIGGFGNAVYITHPNGYTSVYAHLQRFNERISQIIKDYQYRIQSFDVDFPLLPVEIPVKKGEIIAWSGNTGSSGGPHLHFEIRDSQTEETINPQLFGIDIPDRVKPKITALYMYRLNGQAFSEKTVKQYFQIVGSNGEYSLNQNPVIQINGETGFGLITYDEQFSGANKNGVYSTELLLDGKTIFASVLERFSFSNSRAVNSHIDYPTYLLRKSTIQKSFIEPGNPLGIYRTAVNRGLITLNDNDIHNLKYILKDAKGNTSTLSFRIRNNPNSVIKAEEAQGVSNFRYDQQNEYENPGVKVIIPKGRLYSDIYFNYSKSVNARAYSDMHHIHSRLTPLHDVYNLWIKPTKAIPVHLRNKALIVSSTGASVGGTFDNSDGFVKTAVKSFGSYYITLDTIPPSIRPINISDEKTMSESGKISLKISDNLSGIRSFRGTIDGQWVLLEYDFRTGTVWHTFDYRTVTGKHLFQLVVTDMQQNSRTYSATFYR